jgi:antitoxin (DNA-binding transcriptional repressor) of toxin-antitoxin stability system
MNKKSLGGKETSTALLSLATSSSYAQTMARSIDLSEAEKNFAAIAEEVLAGEEIVFSKEGVEVLKLVRVDQPDKGSEPAKKTYLPLGAWAHYDPDFDFDAWDALDEDVRKLFKNMP